MSGKSGINKQTKIFPIHQEHSTTQHSTTPKPDAAVHAIQTKVEPALMNCTPALKTELTHDQTHKALTLLKTTVEQNPVNHAVCAPLLQQLETQLKKKNKKLNGVETPVAAQTVLDIKTVYEKTGNSITAVKVKDLADTILQYNCTPINKAELLAPLKYVSESSQCVGVLHNGTKIQTVSCQPLTNHTCPSSYSTESCKIKDIDLASCNSLFDDPRN